MKQKHRDEQDYYLKFDDTAATEEEREAFFRYDSRGGEIDPCNPVLVAKAHYGMFVNYVRETHDPTLFPGCEMIENYPKRFLEETFGIHRVAFWVLTSGC